MEELLIFFIGIVSGFLGATVGSGGMVSIPALLFLGLPPHIALATNKIADTGIFLSAIKQYWKSNHIEWKITKQLIIITIIGSAIGIYFFTKINAEFLENYIAVVILLFLGFILVNNKLGIKKRKVSKSSIILGLILFFILSINGTIVSAGGASMKLLILIYLLGFNFLEGYATTIPSHVFSSGIPAIAFLFLGYVNIPFAIFLTIGGIIGAYFGSKTAIKKGNKWLKGLFAIVVLISIIKILFF
jgi:hypothetical protein